MQKKELSCQMVGQQGEGIESLGGILAKVLNREGFCLSGFRQFSSRIKGGHTSYKLRIAGNNVGTVNKKCDLLVALDQETFATEALTLSDEGLLLAEPEFLRLYQGPATVIVVPFSEIAKTHGTLLQKNIAALGAVAALCRLREEAVANAVRKEFAAKGEAAVNANLAVLQAGRAYVEKNYPALLEHNILPQADPSAQKVFMTGNEALALGAIAAGARFMAAYPITPASEIMEYMVKKIEQFGGHMLQVEDEIAACTMAIGAAYGGARAFTATSGPGFSLMAEAIGLAEMTETPLVVVNAQRGGPSTGLPTKHEQADLLTALFNTHGDSSKIVLAPGTAEEAFYDMFAAFNLAEEYQCPVIVLSDLQISLGLQTFALPAYGGLEVRRGNLLREDELPEIMAPEYFPRFSLKTDDGISPRVLPGTKNGICLGTGLEHDECGRPNEEKLMHRVQTEKRLHKLKKVLSAYPHKINLRQTADDELLLVGCGGTSACIEEVKELLCKEGHKTGCLQLRLLAPFPVGEVTAALQKAHKILVIEHNATAQLAAILRMNVENCPPLHSILQYDGDIMYPEDLLAACREAL